MATRKSKVLSEALVAALANGASLDDAGELVTKVETTPEAKPKLETPPEVKPAVPEPKTEPKTEVKLEEPKPDALSAYLQTELTRVRDHAGSLTTQLETLKAENARLTTACAGVNRLTKLVQDNCRSLGIALNSRIIGIETLSGEVLADQAEKLKEEFGLRFPIGAQSSVAADAKPEQTTVTPAASRPVVSPLKF